MLCAIDPSIYEWNELAAFVEQALPSYLSRRSDWQLDSIIEAHLASKHESKFLELSGVNIVVVLEMIKDLFLRQPDCPVNELIVSEKAFKRLKKDVQGYIAALPESCEQSDQQQELIQNLNLIREKVPELNRRSFRGILEALCVYLGLEAQSDLKQVINSRNHLVHRGLFHCTNVPLEDRSEKGVPPNEANEYLFLLHFMDRLLLRLVGYPGPCHDWREDLHSE
jgi:hypothetical protein